MGAKTNVNLRGVGGGHAVIGRVVVENAVCSWECHDIVKVGLWKV